MKGDKVLAGTLNNWVKQLFNDDMCIIWGDLDHDEKGRFPDGSRIHTSITPDIPMEEGDVIETRYSKYKLGILRRKGDE